MTLGFGTGLRSRAATPSPSVYAPESQGTDMIGVTAFWGRCGKMAGHTTAAAKSVDSEKRPLRIVISLDSFYFLIIILSALYIPMEWLCRVGAATGPWKESQLSNVLED